MTGKTTLYSCLQHLMVDLTLPRGCVLLSRLANHHPSRFLSYAYLDVAYSPPQARLDFDAINAINQKTHEALGYHVFGYWVFFSEPDAGELLDSHVRYSLGNSLCFFPRRH